MGRGARAERQLAHGFVCALVLALGVGCVPRGERIDRRAAAVVDSGDAASQTETAVPPTLPFGRPATAGAERDAFRGDESRAREIPQGLDLSRERISDGGAFRVSIRTTRSRPPLRKIHPWMVRVLDRSGAPVEGAQIEVAGGMPAHDHGFPTSPRMTKRIGNGTYLIDGVSFNMAGWWEFRLTIQAGAIADEVRFNVVIEEM